MSRTWSDGTPRARQARGGQGSGVQARVLSVHEARLNAAPAVLGQVLEGGFFWLAAPQSLELKQLLAEPGRDGAASPLKLTRTVWALEKLVREAVLALAVHAKFGITDVDALISHPAIDVRSALLTLSPAAERAAT